MATDVERLVVSLEASITKYERAMQKALGNTNATTKRIESRFAKMNGTLGRTFARIGTLFGGALGVAGVQRFVDASIKVENAIRVTGASGEELERVFGRLADIAQRNFAPLETLAALYSRMSLAQKQLNASSEEILQVTDRVALGLRIQGISAQEARGALIQLTQAFGAGIVRAEEFNSIAEGAPILLRAVAAGLEEAGGDIAKLRRLVIDGKVSSEAFFRAFQAGEFVLEQHADSIQGTIGQAYTQFENRMITLARELNKSGSASRLTADALNLLADALEAIASAAPAAEAALNRHSEAVEDLGRVTKNFIDNPSLETFLDFLDGGTRGVSPIQAITEEARDRAAAIDEIRQALIRLQKQGGAVGADGSLSPEEFSGRFSGSPRPVSVEDFPVDPSASKQGREPPFERETRQIKEATAAIIAEQAALAGLNPLVDDYGSAVEKARAEQELLAAAQRAGITITPELRQQISELAGSYAAAGAEAARFAESQDEVRRRAEEFRDLGKEVLGGFISDLRQGKSAADALANALNRVLDKLIEMALNNAFASIFGGGNLVSPSVGLFQRGGYTGSGAANEPAGVVHRGEYVFSKKAVDRAGAGNVEALHSSLKGYANGGMVGMPKISSSGRSGNVNVQIVTPPGGRADVQETRGSNGDINIQAVVEMVVADGAQRPGSPINRALRRNFGVRQQLTARGS